MMKPFPRSLLIVFAAVFLFTVAVRPSSAQTVVVTPTKPPAEKPQTPPKPAEQPTQKPTEQPAQKPGEKPATDKPATDKPTTDKPATQTPPAPAPRPIPPDQAALTAAQKISDPDQKIAAIEKWLKDFPESGGKSTALYSIFDTLVTKHPEDRTRILEYANKYIEAGPENFRASSYSRVAGALLTAGIFIDDAANIAEKGLTVFEQEETKRTQQSRATHLATLGRIRIKQGRVKDAEKALKAAFAANPEVPGAVIGLAELADKRGDRKTASEYWTRAALTGRLTKAERERFENTYRAAHNGSLDGLEATLDETYRTTTKNPVHPEPYKPTPARTNRVVLGEVFTGAGCPPCVAADLAFDAAMERYSRKDFIVVMYHQHIPLPDPLTNKSTLERAKYYTVTGVPTAAIEGVATVGGGPRDATRSVYNRITPSIDKALEVAPDAELALKASISGGVVKVRATPGALKADGEDVKLQIMLVEEMLGYSGENGVRFHPMVVRNIAGANYGGFAVDRKAPAPVDHTFDLAQIMEETRKYIDDYEKERMGTQPTFSFARKPVEMNRGNLSVVAFLQEEKSKKILQTSYVRLDAATTSTASR